MLIEMADNTILFMAVVTCSKIEAHYANERVASVLNRTFRPDDYEFVSPFEQPDYYQTAMFSCIQHMAQEGITWKWENNSLYLFDTMKRINGVKQHTLRVLRLIRLSEDTLQRLKRGVENGTARRSVEGFEAQGVNGHSSD